MGKLIIKIMAIFSLTLFVGTMIYIARRPCGVPIKVFFIGILTVTYAIGMPAYSEALRRAR